MKNSAKISAFFVIASLFVITLIVLGTVIAPPPVKSCKDGNDNDGDGLIDWPDDPGCSSKNDKTETSSSLVCDDGNDNDGDTFTDSSDPGCSSPTDSSELGSTQCDDGIDNSDTDTLVDYPEDTGCTGPSDNDETDGQCDDGIDNDLDFHSDLSDSECTDTTDNDESPRDLCSDNDGFNVHYQGNVSGEEDSSPFTNVDFCFNSSAVREYHCGSLGNDYDPLFSDFVCNGTGVCSNGVCVI